MAGYQQYQQYPPVVVVQRGPGMLVRTVWYLFVGWWLSGFVIFAAAVLTMTVVGIPAGLWIYNRMPKVLTLRPSGVQVVATPYGVRVADTQQYSMVLRAVYFVLVGWWVSMFVAFAAWLVSLTLIGLPAGLWLMNRLPEVTTLRRN